MEYKHFGTTGIKKIWETPAVVEINKNEILGAQPGNTDTATTTT